MLVVPESRGVFPGLTVEENLSVWLRQAKQRASAYERFPILGTRRHQVAGLLSGGEQQMLSLASALARPPELFVVDEPSLGLAPLPLAEIYRALEELRATGAAILLVEEKAKDALVIADTVVLMSLGKIAWSGPRSEADAERLAGAYLGVVTP
jgi:ABC-type branched-subunit amino acid transport system ATPase component